MVVRGEVTDQAKTVAILVPVSVHTGAGIGIAVEKAAFGVAASNIAECIDFDMFGQGPRPYSRKMV